MIDRAVWYFGNCVEEDMQKAEDALGDKAKGPQRTAARQKILDLYMNTGNQQVKGRYREPPKTSRFNV